MSAEDILKGLDELAGLVGSRRRDAIFSAGDVIWTPTSITGSIIRSDWRPVWEKAKEIQEAFNAKPQFPTRADREAAWTRFNQLRDEAGSLRDDEKSEFQAMSNYYRDDIISRAKPLYYDRAADIIVGTLLGRETAEEMKRAGAALNDVARYFSENKHKLTKEHKQEIFEYIQYIRDSHQEFWGEYSRHREQARAAWAEKQEAFKSRTRERIAQNHERLAKAEGALERQYGHLSDLRDKLADARSDDFASRVSGWIGEAEDKIADIQESIQRIRGWISEDEAKLHN